MLPRQKLTAGSPWNRIDGWKRIEVPAYSLLLCLIMSAPLQAEPSKFLGNILSNKDREAPPAFFDYWDQVTPENASKWGWVEKNRDEMRWEIMDDHYRIVSHAGVPLKLHTLMWGMSYPKWLDELSAEEVRAEIEEWFGLILGRYEKVEFVDVVNEPITFPDGPWVEALGGTGESGWDWLVEAYRLARTLRPEIKLILNEHTILKNDEKLQQFLEIVELLKEEKLIDAIGLQAHFLEDTEAAEISRRLDRVAQAGLPIYISELDLNLEDDQAQLARYQAIFPILWEHPEVRGVTLWGYREGLTWLKHSHLIRSDGSPRPALHWLMEYTGRKSVAID